MAKKTRATPLEPSKSYLRFEGVIKRSLNLVKLCPSLEELFDSAGRPHDLSDLTRAAVSLSVAAMDAYFTGVFAEYLVPYLKRQGKVSKKLIHLLEEAGLDTGAALELLTMQRPYRRVRKLMDTHLATHVTQRVEVIDALFNAYGFNGFCQIIQSRSRRKTLLSSVNILIQRRHEIVHKGDVNARGVLQSIDSKTINRRICDVVKLVSTAEELIQKKMSK